MRALSLTSVQYGMCYFSCNGQTETCMRPAITKQMRNKAT